MARARRWVLCALAAVSCAPAAALEFRSIAEPAAVLYDAPSLQAKKLYVMGAGYPVEVVVALEAWTKVRDAGGELSWVETRQLSPRRMVLVTVPVAEARAAAADGAPVVFKAEEGLLLELLEVTGNWVKVGHRDGLSGFVRVNQLWGV